MNNILDKIARGILRFFRNKNLKYGVNSIVVTVIVIALVVVLNLLVGLPQIKFDLTPTKMYSIGDVTKELLTNLENDVEIVCLFDELQPPSSYYVSSNDAQDAMNMLYTYASYPRVSLKFVDPDKNPGLIRELDPNESLSLAKGNFVVHRGAKAKKITLSELFEMQTNQQTYESYVVGMKAEEAFSGAIKYIAAEVTPIVYFVEGHNETSIDKFSSLRNYLLSNNYLVERLSLRGEEKVPEDAELLVFASPKQDLYSQELPKLTDYFRDQGGKAIFMFDYSEYAEEMANFNRILEDFAGLQIMNDKVRSDDDDAHMPDDPYTIVYSASRNAVFTDPLQLILNNSRSVKRMLNIKEWITQTTLLSTSDKSYSEPVDNSQQGYAGPLDIAVAVDNAGGSKASKLVVFGNGAFIDDSAVNMYGSQLYQLNARMFLYTLRWMLGEQDTLTISPKSYSSPRITITQRQSNAIGLFLIIGLPLIIMGAGFVIYLRRRHL